MLGRCGLQIPISYQLTRSSGLAEIFVALFRAAVIMRFVCLPKLDTTERWIMRGRALSQVVAIPVLLLLLAPSTLCAAMIYDFEGLTTGSSLSGQDNWGTLSASWADLNVTTGTGFNTSTVARGPVVLNSAGNKRQNDSNFSFGSFTGTETNVVIQADMRLGTGNFFPPVRASTVGVSGTGGFQFGMNSNSIGSNFFFIRRNGFGDTFSRKINEVDSSFGLNDWMRIQLLVDLSANGGEGLATLRFKNLTDGDTSFSGAGSTLTNKSLNIVSGGDDPTTWDSLLLRVHDGSMVDNVSFEGTTVVPEPSTLALLGIGMAGMLGWRRKCKLAP